MLAIIISWIILTLAILAVAYLLPGVRVDSFGTALFAAAVLGILNAFAKPILVVLTLPLTVITLGLFLIVINALLFWLAAAIVPKFDVRSFWSALGGAVIVSVISWVLNGVLL